LSIDEDVLRVAREAEQKVNEMLGERPAFTPGTRAQSDQMFTEAQDQVGRMLTVALQSAECVAAGRKEDADLLVTFMLDFITALSDEARIYFAYAAVIGMAGLHAQVTGREDLIQNDIDELNKLYFDSEGDA
jgi:hypothetical protein